jgi:VanZ family protein
MYIALVVYASLYPFANWRDQGLPPWGFLAAPVPKYWSGFDVAINVLGYMPLGGLLVLLALRSGNPSGPVRRAMLWASLLSLLMEGMQSYLPQRVASREDWMLNTAGAALGALLALALERAGALRRWDLWQQRWLSAPSRGVMALLLSWPAALLFPAAVPFGLGQIRSPLGEVLEDVFASLSPSIAGVLVGSAVGTPLGPISEPLCVSLGLLVPCLLAFCVVRSVRQRLVTVLAVVSLGFAATGLSAALSWGPAHVWAWLDPTVAIGATLALAAAILLAWTGISWRVSALLALLALVTQMAWILQAPSSPYFAQTLQAWEQGRFIRFNGIAQWLGWAWPYGAMGVALANLLRRGKDT